MIATPAFGHPYSQTFTPQSRPSWFDRAVMKVSLAMLQWARHRAERRAISRAENARRMANERSVVAREHDFALMAARVR